MPKNPRNKETRVGWGGQIESLMDDLRAERVRAEEALRRAKRVVVAAQVVARQNRETASPELQRVLSKLDFALDAYEKAAVGGNTP